MCGFTVLLPVSIGIDVKMMLSRALCWGMQMRIVALVLFAAIVIGCSSEKAPDSTDQKNVQGVTESLRVDVAESEAAGESFEFVIDVRSQREWDAGHVERAAHIPYTEITERIAEVTGDKNARIVVYCAVGGRAGKAKRALERLGYTNVENAGGYDDVKARFE